MQAWLAVQMGWKYEGVQTEKERIQHSYHFEGHPVRVNMQPLYMEQRAPGSVLGMEVTSRLGTQVTMDSRGLSDGVKV